MKIDMTLQGGTDVVHRLQQLPEALSVKVQRDALRVGAEPMRASAQALAPRGTIPPHIHENIVIGPAKKGLDDVSDDNVTVEVGPERKFFYGYFLEYGTVKMSARPFMRPAFDTQAPASLAVIGRELWAAIRKWLPTSFAPSSNTGGGLL